MRAMLQAMTPQQMQRYELFRSCGLPKKPMSRLIKASLERMLQDQDGVKVNVNDKVTLVVAGVAKLFIGELVEAAVEARKTRSDDEDLQEPLTTRELRKAYAQIQSRRKRSYSVQN